MNKESHSFNISVEIRICEVNVISKLHGERDNAEQDKLILLPFWSVPPFVANGKNNQSIGLAK